MFYLKSFEDQINWWSFIILKVNNIYTYCKMGITARLDVCHFFWYCHMSIDCMHGFIAFVHSRLSYPIFWHRAQFAFISRLLFVNFFVLHSQTNNRSQKKNMPMKENRRRKRQRKNMVVHILPTAILTREK